MFARSQEYESLLRCSLVHPFQKCFEAVEAVAPEGAVVAEPVDHGREGVGLSAIVGFASLAAMPHELCALEHGEVLGDGGLRDACEVSQCVDGLFALPRELFEEGAAGGVGESAKDVIGIDVLHVKTITRWLLVCQERRRAISTCLADSRRIAGVCLAFTEAYFEAAEDGDGCGGRDEGSVADGIVTVVVWGEGTGGEVAIVVVGCGGELASGLVVAIE